MTLIIVQTIHDHASMDDVCSRIDSTLNTLLVAAMTSFAIVMLLCPRILGYNVEIVSLSPCITQSFFCPSSGSEHTILEFETRL